MVRESEFVQWRLVGCLELAVLPGCCRDDGFEEVALLGRRSCREGLAVVAEGLNRVDRVLVPLAGAFEIVDLGPQDGLFCAPRAGFLVLSGGIHGAKPTRRNRSWNLGFGLRLSSLGSTLMFRSAPSRD